MNICKKPFLKISITNMCVSVFIDVISIPFPNKTTNLLYIDTESVISSKNAYKWDRFPPKFLFPPSHQSVATKIDQIKNVVGIFGCALWKILPFCIKILVWMKLLSISGWILKPVRRFDSLIDRGYMKLIAAFIIGQNGCLEIIRVLKSFGSFLIDYYRV